MQDITGQGKQTSWFRSEQHSLMLPHACIRDSSCCKTMHMVELLNLLGTRMPLRAFKPAAAITMSFGSLVTLESYQEAL